MKRLKWCILAVGLLAPIDSHAGITLTNIFSFNGTNGALPRNLVRAGNNKFYGITEAGGPNFTGPDNEDVGGVYSITSNGVFSNLYFFEGTNGNGGEYLTPGSDGNFYGTTGDTVFKLNPDGTMANPHFGALPSSSDALALVQDQDGTLYGAIRNGGSSSLGSIYKIDTNGVFSTLVAISDTNDAAPMALLLGSDNNFYGLAAQSSGFSVFAGSIFRMDRNGNLTNIYLFSDLGGEPSWLVQGSDGDLYGLTVFGGTNGLGSIFRVTTNGVLIWSFSFNGTNGYGPLGLTMASDGNFYGVTDRGGPNYTPNTIGDGAGYGTIFRITPGGSFTSLAQFDGTNDSQPATIAQGTDGNLYGATQGGGTYGQGAIFKLTLPACPATNRLMLTTVANFTNGPYGSDFPEVGLTQAGDGMLYGVAQYGGTFNLGTVFRTTLSGSLTTLVSFNGTNGMYPIDTPVQAADGNFYGTTSEGGPDWNATNNAYGTIYRMDSNGVVTTLFSFNQTNGSGPASVGGLILGNDGAYYGVAPYGGPDFTNEIFGDGTIFKITTNGNFTLLASFNGTNGVTPISIIRASDGNFYGTTRQGGTDDTHGLGTVFQMTPGGQINTLFRFNGTNGAGPGAIMQASDGCLYGMTSEGGPTYTGVFPNNGFGTVFKITTNGDFTLLSSFNGTNGSNPTFQLTEICNGIFYGTAVYGGEYPNGGYDAQFNQGTFFQVTTNGDLTALLSFGANSLMPARPFSSLTKASDGNFYGLAQGPNGGSIFCIRPVQAPVLQPLAQGSQINLSWNAWLGYSYAVMYETNLTGSNWTLLSTVTPQTNGVSSFSDSIGTDAQRFYSVIMMLSP